MDKIWEKLEDHELRLRKLENTISEVKGELRINTALTLVVLGSIEVVKMEDVKAYLTEKKREIEEDIKKAKEMIGMARKMGFNVADLEAELTRYEAQLKRIEKALKESK